ncbi:MAG TPA: glycosyltransferase family 2 protein [Solirubrobacterales bacterium]|jgi:cellulose synthase/poly-beta-1,6-N-acetylglucosamine synthase-like glycosyltransferase|nr:glycosyltransferase family 2 protein [Solirubrobacterales bacterium]
MIVVEILFWACAALIVYTHVGYPLVLYALVWLRGRAVEDAPARVDAAARLDPSTISFAPREYLPTVSLLVPAYDEEEVIAAKVANALALDYPRERLQIVVASDGSTDATAEHARAAGADLVLELPRAGKSAAQNAAVAAATGEVLAFSDANSVWAPDALHELVAPFADPAVGYVCGQVRFSDPAGDNLEGAYWRYEMAVREMESALAGVTAGNGAIYAVRREAYIPLPPSGSHDLSFPFELAKRGLRSIYLPAARAEEKMVPTLEGEFARKRRMMVGLWDIVVGEGMLSPRGYSPLFAFELASHRLLRYLSPFLHLLVFAANVALLGEGWVYAVTFAVQMALLAAALLGGRLPLAPFRIARYYVMTTASIAAGLWDRWRQGAPGRWEKAEGTR